MKSVIDLKFDGDASDIENVMNEDVFSDRTLERIQKESPVFYGTLEEKGLASALIMRYGTEGKNQGYLICAVERSYRIWQDNECAILYYLAGMLD